MHHRVMGVANALGEDPGVIGVQAFVVVQRSGAEIPEPRRRRDQKNASPDEMLYSDIRQCMFQPALGVERPSVAGGRRSLLDVWVNIHKLVSSRLERDSRQPCGSWHDNSKRC